MPIDPKPSRSRTAPPALAPRFDLLVFAPYLAFFLSGASSLIFQTIWTRMLHHVFGATSVAISTVLTVFMAGLGLGAWISGRYASRIRHPIITYAIAEIGVGLWGLLVPTLVRSDGWLADVNAALRESLGAESWMFMVARFLCVVPILLVPTTLMGSTLPLLTRHFVHARLDARAASAKVGILYAVNTFGAAAGPLLSAFVLMPNVGLAVTNVVACSMNFTLAALIWVTRKHLLADTWKPGEKLSFLPGSPSTSEVEPAKEASAPDAPESPAEDELGTPPKKSAKKAKRAAIEPARREAPLDEPERDEEERDPPVPDLARKAAFFAFAASGAAALAYEVVWSRALAMVIGSSIYSFALILETFLIGIAVGSAAMGVLMSKARHLLIGLAVASSGLVLMALSPRAIDITYQGATHEGSLLKFAIFAALFIAPIVLVLVASQTRSGPLRGNSVLAPAIFMIACPLTAGALNVFPFLGVGLPGYLPQILSSVVTVIALFLLVAVLLRRAPVLMLAIVQLFIAGATVVSYVWQDEIPYAFAQLVVSIPEEQLADHVGTVQFFTFLTAILCTLPATLGMGAMFPLTMRVWTSGGDRIARDVAVVYTGNTVGSIIGSWLPGFVLFMWIGAERTLHVGVLLNMVLALVMLIAGAADTEETSSTRKAAKAGERKKKPEGLPLWHAITVYALSPLIPALLALFYLGTKDPDSALRWNLTHMTLGVFRLSLAEGMLDEQAWGSPDLVYYRDGLTTTVSVERWGRHLALKNNGKVDASNGDDMPTQINVATYPLLLHSAGPENLDVAIVGFGSGVTVGTTLGFPVRRVDVVELERSIPEAARHFEEYNRLQYRLDHWPYVQQDRLTIINDDGRNYLASTRQQYDIIISEPSNPWITGVSDLFTVDHWRITKQRLRPGGIYCQWVQLYELSPENIKIIYRTFAEQFRHVMVLSADDRSSDTVMLGSDRPIVLDLERAQRTYRLPGVADALERANVYSPHDIFARTLFASREEVLQYTQVELHNRGGAWEEDVGSTNGAECAPPSCRREPVVLNTDDNAHIEFAAPRDLIGFARYQDYLSTIYSEEWPYGHPRAVLQGFGQRDAAARNYAELAMSLIAHGRYGWAGDFIELSQQTGRARETAVALEVLTRLLTSDNEPAIEIEPPLPGPEMDADTARQLQEGFDSVRDSVDARAYGAALVAMESIPAPLRLHSGPAMRFLYGYLLYKAADGQYSQYHAAVEQLEGLLHGEEDYVVRHPEVYYFLAKAHNEEGNYSDALRSMRAYVEARLVPLDRDDQEVPEPPLPESPTSDAPGEAPKDTHDERGNQE